MGNTATLLVCLGVGIAGGLLALAVQTRRARKQIHDAFKSRLPLDDQTFFERYFAPLGVSAEVAIGVRECLAEAVGENLSRLKDSDNIAENLKPLFELDSLADVLFMTSLEKRFGINILEEEAQQMNTVRDIVLLVDHKVKSKAA